MAQFAVSVVICESVKAADETQSRPQLTIERVFHRKQVQPVQ
jgi:hypothetical protein